MKRTMIHGLVLSLSASLLVACGGTTDSSSSSGSKLLATTTACYAAWNSTTAYTAGQTASYASVNYTAAFWTQGQNPSTNNGPAGSGQPWVNNGACGSTSTSPTMTEASSISTGSNLSVSYSVPSSQASSTNWIGVYAAGVTPGSGTKALTWIYAPNASGSVTVNTSGLAAGNYAVWYLYNDGYTVLKGPQSLAISSSAPTMTEAASINAGSNLSVTYSVPSSQLSAKNWIGVYRAGVTPSSSNPSSAWAYAPNASGSVTVNTSGLAAGSYAVWYLYNDGYTVLSGPRSLSIASNNPTISEPSSINAGSNLTVSYSVPSAKLSSTNWVGVYPAGVTPSSSTQSSAWAYAPNASGSVTVNTSGLSGGNYAVWYLYNDGYTVLSGPQNLTINGGTQGSGLPKHTLTGYWHNFTNPAGATFPLSQVPDTYDIIVIAFADDAGSGKVSFTPDPASGGQSQMIADIQAKHAKGKKVIISIGGQNGNVDLSSSGNVTNFVNSLSGIIRTYGLDGFDIDLENGMNAANMVSAMRSLRSTFGANFIITMAPQTIDVQPNSNSAYMQVINSAKDIITTVHTQFYNSGSMLGRDGKVYSQGTEDFLTALADTLMTSLRPDQVAFGLPATSAAAGGGYVSPSVVNAALDCMATGTNCGSYHPVAQYPSFRGAMDWSINWDKTSGYAFANTVKPKLNSMP